MSVPMILLEDLTSTRFFEQLQATAKSGVYASLSCTSSATPDEVHSPTCYVRCPRFTRHPFLVLGGGASGLNAPLFRPIQP